jgi:hypothetical protein
MNRHYIPSLTLHLQKLCLSAQLCKSGFIIVLAFFVFISFGCEEEVPLPMQVTDAEVPKEKELDAEPLPVVPQSAPEIFKNLPYPPSQILRKPGDAVGNLRNQLPKLQVTYSSRYLAETREDGPFRNIVYQLDKKRRKVEAVTATFHQEYMHKTRRDHLKINIEAHLGNGKDFNEKNWRGTRWTNMDYRIELRIDKASKDVELLFHQRGAETLERAKKGIPKSMRK